MRDGLRKEIEEMCQAHEKDMHEMREIRKADKAEMDSIKSRLTTLEQRVSKVEQRLSDTGTHADGIVDDVNSAFAEIIDPVVAEGGSIDDVRSQIETLKARVDAVEEPWLRLIEHFAEQ